MRAFRGALIDAGLPNKKIEQDVIGNVAAQFDISRQTAAAMDYIIAEIDGQTALLSANIAKKAVAEASCE